MDIRRDLSPQEGVNTLNGFYRGVVIDNRDPDLDQIGITFGRVMVNIPALMKTPEAGIWAYPANNPMGGRNRENLAPDTNKNGGKMEYCGSFYVPPTGSFVIIFFEGGDPNRPFYMGGLDIKAHEAPPEINIGVDKKPEERWLVFRSPQGRTIVVSDDEDNCRIEITGKKRKAAGDTSAHVYDISGNQKTILIDDRDGKEKILIEDQKGNYVNIKTFSNDIDVHANGNLRLNAGGNIFIKAGGNVNIEGSKINTQSGSFNANAGSFLAAAGDVSLTGDCRLGPTVHLCEGTTSPGGVDGDDGPSGDRGASSGKSGSMTYYVSTGGGAPDEATEESSEDKEEEKKEDQNPEESEEEKEEGEEEESEEEEEGSGIVCIDAGHGGKDPGALNTDSKAPTEAQYNLEIANALNSELTALGIETLMTRSSDVYIAPGDRPDIANNADAELFVSIHHNSASNATATGTEVWVYTTADSETRSLASSVLSAITKKLGVKSRGVKTNNYAVLRKTNMPAILIETLFMSSESDMKIAAGNTYAKDVAAEVAKCIKDYLDKSNG